MTQDTLYIVIPAYNEEANIRHVVEEWYPQLEGKGERSRLVINCSGSTDGTRRILQSLQESCPGLVILTDSENSYGAKVLDLYRYALEKEADFIFQTDSDGQTDPAEFPAFWELRETYDCIIGNRKHRGDGAMRGFVQKVETAVIRHYFKVKVPDANTPFRLMKQSLLAKVLGKMPETYSMPNLLMTALVAAGHEKILFREISFGARRTGKNSMNYRKIAAVGIESIRVFKTLLVDNVT